MRALWADSYRDLYGFERIFFHIATISALKYIQYFCGLRLRLGRKIFPSKLQSTPKRGVFCKTNKETTARLMICTPKVRHFWGVFLWAKPEEKIKVIVQNIRSML